MSEISIKTLEDVPFSAIYETFTKAFSDYVVKMEISAEDFQFFMSVRGVDYSKSAGVYNGGQLVGLVLNGLGPWRGQAAAYDAGSGVVKDFRRRGYSKDMFAFISPILRSSGVKRYVLEVLIENKEAFNLYRGLGFNTSRELGRFRLPRDSFCGRPRPELSIAEVPVAQWNKVQGLLLGEEFTTFQPAWQNTWESIHRGNLKYKVLVVIEGATDLGYLIYTPTNGAINQLWVSPKHRRRGIASTLIGKLLSLHPQHPVYSWTNLDLNARETVLFLEAMGFEKKILQYEMERSLE